MPIDNPPLALLSPARWDAATNLENMKKLDDSWNGEDLQTFRKYAPEIFCPWECTRLFQKRNLRLRLFCAAGFLAFEFALARHTVGDGKQLVELKGPHFEDKSDPHHVLE